MNRKNKIWVYQLFLTGIVIIFATGCNKNDNNNTLINTVTDIDGNIYHTITIGTQTWMVENLKTTKYRDSTSIPLVTDSSEWGKPTPGYCWYNNDEATYKNTYGALYNWSTVNTNNLCPTGWHVPTNAEFEILINYLGGELVAGGKLKETDTTHWHSPNSKATNESNFTGLPGGYRSCIGKFKNIGYEGSWWTSTMGTYSPWYFDLKYDMWFAGRDDDLLECFGFSVRCIKD